MKEIEVSFTQQDPVPLECLHGVDPNDVVLFLEQEHPQVIALVLAVLRDKEHALDILHALPEEIQVEIIQRIAEMTFVSPEVIELLDKVLTQTIQDFDNNRNIGGIKALVDLFLSSDRSLDSPLLLHVEEQDPDLAEQIREQL
ncbi:hypothetical protein WDW89_24255 [Deltaproteobacteria bacterium TL4]